MADTANAAPRRQFAWWRPGGFRLPLLARLTHGKAGLGRWTPAEIAAIDARAEAGVKALLWCNEHAEPRCVHSRVLPYGPGTSPDPGAAIGGDHG